MLGRPRRRFTRRRQPLSSADANERSPSDSAGHAGQRRAAPRTKRGSSSAITARDLLGYALNPGEVLGQGGGTFVSVKRITPTILPRMSLPIYSIIVLYGVTELSEQSVKDLVAFVTNGGGVWLIPDREMSPLRFNEVFGPLLGGLAIGQLKQPEQVQNLGRERGASHASDALSAGARRMGSVRDVYFSEYFGLESPGRCKLRLATERAIRWPASFATIAARCSCNSSTATSKAARCRAARPSCRSCSKSMATLGAARRTATRPTCSASAKCCGCGLPEFRELQGDVRVAGREDTRIRDVRSPGRRDSRRRLAQGRRVRSDAPLEEERPQTLADRQPRARRIGPDAARANGPGGRCGAKRTSPGIPYAQLDDQFARRTK